MMKVEICEWDSNFFNKKIAKISCGNIDDEVGKEINRLKDNGIELIYLFTTDSSDLAKQIHLSNITGYLVDQKVIYRKKVKNALPESSDSIKSINHLSSDLLDLSYASGEFSRFKVDPNFTELEFRALYKKWIENALAGEFGDVVLGYYLNSTVIGMVTLEYSSKNASIGLIAVDHDFRGQQIGKKLLAQVEFMCHELGIDDLSVATQLDNKKACNFYEKNGYSISSINNIYHFWI